MATNLAIDPELLEHALQIGGHMTKKATVTEALQEYIRKRRSLEVLQLFGTIEYEDDYDYKEQRKHQ